MRRMLHVGSHVIPSVEPYLVLEQRSKQLSVVRSAIELVGLVSYVNSQPMAASMLAFIVVWIHNIRSGEDLHYSE